MQLGSVCTHLPGCICAVGRSVSSFLCLRLLPPPTCRWQPWVGCPAVSTRAADVERGLLWCVSGATRRDPGSLCSLPSISGTCRNHRDSEPSTSTEGAGRSGALGRGRLQHRSEWSGRWRPGSEPGAGVCLGECSGQRERESRGEGLRGLHVTKRGGQHGDMERAGAQARVQAR